MAEGDVPSVQHTPTPTVHTGGIKGFLTTNTAGMPNWVWLTVIGIGVAAAIIIPKFLNKGSSTPTTGSDMSGIGLAVDPTTGLPYAVEGLVPSGGTGGGGLITSGSNIPTTTPATPTGQQFPGGSANGPLMAGTSSFPSFSWIGTLKPGTTYSLGGFDPTTGLQRFWYTEPGGTTQEAWLPAGATIVKGAQGRIWINRAGLPTGQQGIQVTGTQPDWPGSTTQMRVS